MLIAELHEIPVTLPSPKSAGSALAELRREFTRRGWNRRSIWPITLALAIHCTLILAGTILGLWAWASAPPGGFVLTAVGILLASVGSLGIGTTTHTSSHYAASAKRGMNEFLTLLGFSVLSGLSATYWWRGHVSGHHTHPNVEGADGSIDFLPLFALTETQVASATGWRQKYYKSFQPILVPVAMLLLLAHMMATGLAETVKRVLDPKGRRGTHILDLLGMVAHIGLFVGIPLLYAPLSHVLVFYFARLALVSVGLVLLLIPSHFPVETPVMDREEARAIGHCALQTYTTINYNGGLLVHLLSTGLDYQIEHHLFPEISHVYYPRMSPLVQQFCKEQGLPYRTWPLSTALRESYRVFLEAKPMGINLAMF